MQVIPFTLQFVVHSMLENSDTLVYIPVTSCVLQAVGFEVVTRCNAQVCNEELP